MAAAAVLLDDVHRAEIAYIPTLTMPGVHMRMLTRTVRLFDESSQMHCCKTGNGVRL